MLGTAMRHSYFSSRQLEDDNEDDDNDRGAMETRNEYLEFDRTL
jgi:hypothetical protein